MTEQSNQKNLGPWKRMGRVLVLLTLVISLSACTVSPVALSASTTPLRRGEYTEIGEASGRAFGVMAFGIPLTEFNMAGAARDRALESSGGDALINVSMDHLTLQYSAFAIFMTTVSGTAVKINKDEDSE